MRASFPSHRPLLLPSPPLGDCLLAPFAITHQEGACCPRSCWRHRARTARAARAQRRRSAAGPWRQTPGAAGVPNQSSRPRHLAGRGRGRGSGGGGKGGRLAERGGAGTPRRRRRQSGEKAATRRCKQPSESLSCRASFATLNTLSRPDGPLCAWNGASWGSRPQTSPPDHGLSDEVWWDEAAGDSEAESAPVESHRRDRCSRSVAAVAKVMASAMGRLARSSGSGGDLSRALWREGRVALRGGRPGGRGRFLASNTAQGRGGQARGKHGGSGVEVVGGAATAPTRALQSK